MEMVFNTFYWIFNPDLFPTVLQLNSVHFDLTYSHAAFHLPPWHFSLNCRLFNIVPLFPFHTHSLSLSVCFTLFPLSLSHILSLLSRVSELCGALSFGDHWLCQLSSHLCPPCHHVSHKADNLSNPHSLFLPVGREKQPASHP